MVDKGESSFHPIAISLETVKIIKCNCHLSYSVTHFALGNKNIKLITYILYVTSPK